MTREQQILEYATAKKAWEAAMRALNDARRDMDAVADNLRNTLLFAVPKNALNRTITLRSGDECLVVDKHCPSWAPDKVNPIIVHKIAKGKQWGKIRKIARNVCWDFEVNDWRIEP